MRPATRRAPRAGSTTVRMSRVPSPRLRFGSPADEGETDFYLRRSYALVERLRLAVNAQDNIVDL